MKKIILLAYFLLFCTTTQTYHLSCCLREQEVSQLLLKENDSEKVHDVRKNEKTVDMYDRKVIPPIGKEVIALSIDGGGVRGIIPAVIISIIEEMINEKMEDGKEHHIADYIDCISGISVGGIISTLLAVSDVDGHSCYSGIDIYNLLFSESKNIFTKNIFSCLGLLKPLYTNEKLIKIAKEKLLLTSNGEFYPTLSDIKKVNFIGLCVDIANEKTLIYKNWKASENSDYNYYLHDVAVSTSSAPYYFPSYYVESINGKCKHKTSDGGICLNNPSQIVYNSMHKFFPNKKVNIISIGTGEEINKSNIDYSKGESGILFSINDVINSFMWSDSYNIDYALKNDTFNVNYERLQTPLINASSAMDNVKTQNIHDLTTDAFYYIESNFEAFQKITNMLITNKFPEKENLKILNKYHVTNIVYERFFK